MVHINRESILKNFLDKVKEAKRMQMRDVKIPVKELDDIAYVIYQLMAEEISKALEKLEVKPTEEVVKTPINRRVLEEIHIVKKQKEETPIVEEKKEEIIETEPIKEDNIKIEEESKQVIEEPEEDNTEEDDEEYDDNSLYGGSW